MGPLGIPISVWLPTTSRGPRSAMSSIPGSRRLVRKCQSLTIAALVLSAAAPASADDLTETRRDRLSPRLIELGFAPNALPGETNVRVLLPDGYDTQPGRRWPVLYLRHGCCGVDVRGSQAWTTHGEAEQGTAGLRLIVVMADGGRGGMYSDWLAPGASGRALWETYHLEQLVPWVDRELRTIARREGRAIAGLSMGGFGAMKYAATHPDRFVAAASLSGIVDSNTDDGAIHAGLPGFDGGTPASVWGPRRTDELRWRSQNPWDLAENLRPLQIALRTGNGQPGPYDEQDGRSDGVEEAAHRNSVSLHERFGALGIAHTWDDYGPGKHTWPYWARGLRQTLSQLMPLFSTPSPPPSKTTSRPARPAFEIFGWRVSWNRDQLAFSRLADADAAGFVLEGAGAADVRTPAAYAEGSPPEVTVDGVAAPADIGGDGRLRVRVSTGADERAVDRITTPAVTSPGRAERRPCTSRRRVTITLPRGLRRVRATLDGRPTRVRGRRVPVDLSG